MRIYSIGNGQYVFQYGRSILDAKILRPYVIWRRVSLWCQIKWLQLKSLYIRSRINTYALRVDWFFHKKDYKYDPEFVPCYHDKDKWCKNCGCCVDYMD